MPFNQFQKLSNESEEPKICLLFTRTAGVSEHLTDDWLRDFYSRNRDGYGVMYAEDGIIYTQKGIGSAEDWIKFYRKHEHRTAAFHLRMKTHGKIDLINCHPYEVYGDGAVMPVYLMHNGVLSHGNAKDVSKSDTWHFIRDYIIPLTEKQPEVIFTPEFQAVMGKFIGNNRFALMNHKGQLQIVNHSQGVDWKGMWLSNTYAWDYYKAFPMKSRYPAYDDTPWRNNFPKTATSIAPKTKVKTPAKVTPMHSIAKPTDENLDEEIIAAFEDIDVRSREVSGKVTATQLERFFKELGSQDAWAYIEAFTYSTGEQAEKKFLAGIEDPRKAREWINAIDTLNQKFPVLS